MSELETRDLFRVEGVGCWCPPEMTLGALRIMGHTEKCTCARQGWEANYRHLREIERRRAADREVGRQVREAAAHVMDVRQETLV
jgi:hypothetical protein